MPDRKLLWGRAANLCSYRSCRRELSIESFIVGQEAHIVSPEENGPRYDPDYPDHLLHGYENRVLLCLEHHVIVDRDMVGHPPEVLRQMKDEHERWVKATLHESGPDPIDITYAYLVDGWHSRFLLGDAWEITAAVFRPRMNMLLETTQQFDLALKWLYSRRYPARYPQLDEELRRFEQIAIALQHLLGSVLDTDRADDVLLFRPFYKTQHGDDQEALFDYRWIHALACDLAFELGRSSNAICDEVRKVVDPFFRLGEGLVLIGEEDGFGSAAVRTEYRPGERRFTTLESFLHERSTRDRHCDAGIRITALAHAWPSLAREIAGRA